MTMQTIANGESGASVRSKLNGNFANLYASAHPFGPREPAYYHAAQAVRSYSPYAVLGGFRFHGKYKKLRCPVIPMPESAVASLPGDLTYLSATKAENWYAVFACADEGDSEATLVITPYFRCGTPSGSVIPFVEAGERKPSPVASPYAFIANNNMAGAEILVIRESGGWRGRVTTVTANTNDNITLDAVGSIASGDWLLPAPSGFDHYGYLYSFYRDSAEVRNLYDTGTVVKAKGAQLLVTGIDTGSVPSFTEVNCEGHISPLATAIIIDVTSTLSTASTGSFAEYFSPDSGSHTVQTCLTQKEGSTSRSAVHDGVIIPFLYPQRFWYSNAGGVVASRISGKFDITGWFEN